METSLRLKPVRARNLAKLPNGSVNALTYCIIIILFFNFGSVLVFLCGSVAVFVVCRLSLAGFGFCAVKVLMNLYHCFVRDGSSFNRQSLGVSYCVGIALMAGSLCLELIFLFNCMAALFYYFDVYNG